MPATPAIEVPVTLDLAPAADAITDLAVALEVTAAFLKSKAEDLRQAPAREHFREAGRQLIEDFLAAGAITTSDLEDALIARLPEDDADADPVEAVVFEDPIARADSVGVEVTD